MTTRGNIIIATPAMTGLSGSAISGSIVTPQSLSADLFLRWDENVYEDNPPVVLATPVEPALTWQDQISGFNFTVIGGQAVAPDLAAGEINFKTGTANHALANVMSTGWNPSAQSSGLMMIHVHYRIGIQQQAFGLIKRLATSNYLLLGVDVSDSPMIFSSDGSGTDDDEAQGVTLVNDTDYVLSYGSVGGAGGHRIYVDDGDAETLTHSGLDNVGQWMSVTGVDNSCVGAWYRDSQIDQEWQGGIKHLANFPVAPSDADRKALARFWLGI